MNYLKYFIVGLFLVSSAHASISSIELKGKVVSYDVNSVKIDQKGQTFWLDRALVKEKKIAIGQEISVELTPEQFNQLAAKQKDGKK